MKSKHDHGEYHAYKSTTDDSKKGGSGGGGSGRGPGTGGWIVIGIVVIMLISFISDGASFDAIETLLGFGIIAYLLVKWLLG